MHFQRKKTVGRQAFYNFHLSVFNKDVLLPPIVFSIWRKLEANLSFYDITRKRMYLNQLLRKSMVQRKSYEIDNVTKLQLFYE